VITILGLILIIGGVIALAKTVKWWVSLAPYPSQAAEPPEMEEPPPCQMCDGELVEGHDCAQLAKAALTPDCPTIVAGSDLDEALWAGIVEPPELAAIDVKALEGFYGLTNPPYVPRHAKQED